MSFILYITFPLSKAQGSFQKKAMELVETEGVDDYKESLFWGYSRVEAHIEVMIHLQDLGRLKSNQT